MASLVLRVTPRFLRQYNKAVLGQQMAEGAVHDFVRAYESNPTDAPRQYQRVQGLRRNDVLEFKIGGGHRMIGLWQPPTLTLLAVGDHSTTRSVTKADPARAASSATEAPDQFWPTTTSRFFLRAPSDAFRLFGTEMSSNWLYFLDHEQDQIATAIFEHASELFSGPPDEYAVHLVLGGPGTGKTCVLLNLLKRFDNDGFGDIGVLVSPQVREYVQQSLGIDMSRFRDCERESIPGPPQLVTATDAHTAIPGTCAPPSNLVLVDDPPHLDTVKTICDRAANDEYPRFVVLALDPLQLGQALSDAELDSLVAQFGVRVHELHTCYRQKEHVGKAAKRVMDAVAQSTPFLHGPKKAVYAQRYSKVTALSNNLVFTNRFGYAEVVENATADNFRDEIQRIRTYKGGLWRHWPPVMIALIDPELSELPEEWSAILRHSRLDVRTLRGDELGLAKGVEYQHVIVVVGEKLFRQLDRGFEGSGQAQYNRRRLLRIPFSRAKDSIVAMVPSAE
jgi:hypothetical protein